MIKGIPLGFEVFCTVAWIPNKGMVKYSDMTNDEIKEIKRLFKL